MRADRILLYAVTTLLFRTLLMVAFATTFACSLAAQDDPESAEAMPRWTVAVDSSEGPVWIDMLLNNSVEYSVRIGPGGSIADLQHRLTGGRRLLAPSWQGEETDRIVQWTIWSDLLRLDNKWDSRLNVTQGGMASGEFSEVIDVKLSKTPTRARLVVTSKHDQQWLDRVEQRIQAVFPAVTIYDASNGVLSIDRYILVHSMRKDNVAVHGTHLYVEGWSPFSDFDFSRIVMNYDANGNPSQFFTDGVNVPYYPRTPVNTTRGFVTLYDHENLQGPKLHVLFGRKEGLGGARSILNMMDFSGGLAVLPAIQKDYVEVGSLIHQHTRIAMTRGLGSNVVKQLDAEVAKMPESGIYAPTAIPDALRPTAIYLRGMARESGLRTDQLGLFLE